MTLKARAEGLYEKYLIKMRSRVGSTTTYDKQLHKVAKKLYGKKFKGVFSADKIPKLKRNTAVIANLDNSDEPGSHWVGIVNDKHDIAWVYDSFGRTLHKILPDWEADNDDVYDKIKMTESDAEQHPREHDCGARVLAWLEVFFKHGAKYAKYI